MLALHFKSANLNKFKNQHKILDQNPFTVRYQGINYQVNYEKEKSIEITIRAVMDQTRYKNRKCLNPMENFDEYHEHYEERI